MKLEPRPKKLGFFGQILKEILTTSLIEMLELLDYGHMAKSTI